MNDQTVSAKYAFERAPASLSSNSVSTDAVNALERWKARAPSRDYEELTELEDEPAVFRLSFLQSDADTDAGGQLDDECVKRGVARAFVAE